MRGRRQYRSCVYLTSLLTSTKLQVVLILKTHLFRDNDLSHLVYNESEPSKGYLGAPAVYGRSAQEPDVNIPGQDRLPRPERDQWVDRTHAIGTKVWGRGWFFAAQTADDT